MQYVYVQRDECVNIFVHTIFFFFFFFQAEDGIRDGTVTGVQTCALPISSRWTLGEQAGVVPSVADRLLASPGRALDEQRGIAADRCGEVLRQPALCRPRYTEEEQGTIGREGRDGDLDEPPVPDVFRRDLPAVLESAADDEGHHRPWREPPAGRALLLVEASEGIEL